MRNLLSSPAAIWISAIIMGVGTLISRSRLNELLQLFAKIEPQLWREAGEPSGLFSAPRGRRFFTQGPEVDWLTNTPPWVRSSPAAQRVLSVARLGTVVMVIGFLGLLAVVAWSW